MLLGSIIKSEQKRIRALLFDFDGVMADTMRYHLAAWEQVLSAHYGFHLDEMVVKLNEGRPVLQIAQAIFRAAAQPHTEELLRTCIAEKSLVFKHTHQAKVYPENRQIIERARSQGILVGLVTGTFRKNLALVLPEPWMQLFDVIITDGDTLQGKPFPDPYLAAAERLNVLPTECVAIENAPLGIQSAKAAGMVCIAVQTTLPEEHLKQADVIVATHAELLLHLTAGFFCGFPV